MSSSRELAPRLTWIAYWTVVASLVILSGFVFGWWAGLVAGACVTAVLVLLRKITS